MEGPYKGPPDSAKSGGDLEDDSFDSLVTSKHKPLSPKSIDRCRWIRGQIARVLKRRDHAPDDPDRLIYFKAAARHCHGEERDFMFRNWLLRDGFQATEEEIKEALSVPVKIMTTLQLGRLLRLKWEERKALKTWLIAAYDMTKAESRRRMDTERKRERRGSTTRAEYLKTHRKTQKRERAAAMGISVRHLNRLIRAGKVAG
jgi:hypothetical protein